MKKYLKWLIIILFIMLILSPILFNGKQIMGDDSIYHIQVIEQMEFGKPMPYLIYFGQAIVGYPMNLMKNLVSIDTLYLWFSYIALIFTGLVFYLITTKLYGYIVGLMAMIFPIFGASSILYQWYEGVIFNIINIVVMISGIYVTLKWLENKKLSYLILAIFLFVFALVFHLSGFYVVIILPLLALSYIVTKEIGKRFIVMLTSFSIVLFVTACFPFTIDPHRQLLDGITFITIPFIIFLKCIIDHFKSKVYNLVAYVFMAIVAFMPIYNWLSNAFKG